MFWVYMWLCVTWVMTARVAAMLPLVRRCAGGERSGLLKVAETKQIVSQNKANFHGVLAYVLSRYSAVLSLLLSSTII